MFEAVGEEKDLELLTKKKILDDVKSEVINFLYATIDVLEEMENSDIMVGIIMFSSFTR